VALDAIPAWLASVIADKLFDAGIAAARDQLKELPPTEDQLKKYIINTKSKVETIPRKISCVNRNADLHSETFFLWPKLEAESKEQNESLGIARKERLQEPIEAQDLLFRPPPGKTLFAIEGPAGVGKTTLARSLVYWAAKETLKLHEGKTAEAKLARPHLPIYLDASDLAKIADDQSLSTIGWDRLPDNWGLLLVVDGLDEIEQSLRDRALQRMKGPWLQEADKSLIFMFGRPGSVRSISWESREERILALELRPWTLDEVDEYLKKWVQEGSLRQEEAKHIFRHVKENFRSNVKPHYTFIPLHIYLFVCNFLATRNFENLPRTRLDLYEKYLIYATLYQAEGLTKPTDKASERTARPLSEGEIFALGCLELTIKANPKLESSIHKSRASCNAQMLLSLQRQWNTYCKGYMSSNMPWNELLKLWQERGLCWLGHRSFHDFLSAKALTKIYEGRPKDFWREWLHLKIFDPYWMQTLVFATALFPDSDRERILEGLLALGDCDPISGQTGRHHEVIAEIIGESESVEEEFLNAWLSHEPAPEYIARIHRTVPEWSLSVLEKLAQDQDPGVRRGAAVALAQLGEKALPALEKLAQDQDPEVRRETAVALAHLGEKALPALEKLAQDQDPWVRGEAAWPLAHLGEKALPILEKLAQDQDPGVRLEAARALAQLGEKASPALEKLAQDQDPGVRLEAARALAQLGYHEKALPILEKLAQDQDPLVSLIAAWALARLGHPPLCLEELPED